MNKQRRLRLIKSSHYICQKCGEKKDFDALNIHHNGHNLLVVCRSCHGKLHAEIKQQRKDIRRNMFVTIDGKKTRLSDLKLLYLIVKDFKRHPELTHKAIAEKYGTTLGYVKRCSHIAHERGIHPEPLS